jgi:prepilin signal peptidase PulO-like enzyme (type II secretory pathway)
MDFLSMVSLPVQVSILFGFGVIIGSFLNVVLYRLHTGKSLSGHSHCLSCGRQLRAYELIPLLSYMCLRGTCRMCHSYIPIRYFLVELLTGILFVLVYLISTSVFGLFLGLLFVSVLVLVVVYDLRHLIIPDELVFWLTGIALVQSGYELVLSENPVVFMSDLGAAFLGALFFYFLWRISSGRWIGFGDVKLAVPLGFMLGAAGVFSMIVLAFWVGAIVGVLLLTLQWMAVKRGQPYLRLGRRTLTMKSALPFAPFLITGFLLVWLCEVNVVTLLSYGA